MVHAKMGILMRPNENHSSEVLGDWKVEREISKVDQQACKSAA